MNDIITIKIKATIEVKFKSYDDGKKNALAKEQALIWVEETLKDEEQIPFFVVTNSGEESISKSVKVEEIENE
jgi:hypothetical protein